MRSGQTVGRLDLATEPVTFATLRLAHRLGKGANITFGMRSWCPLATRWGPGWPSRLTRAHEPLLLLAADMAATIGMSTSRRGCPHAVRPSLSTSTSSVLPDRTRRSSLATDNRTIRRSRPTARSIAKIIVTMSRSKAALSFSVPNAGSMTRRSTSEPGRSVPRATEPKSDTCKGLTAAMSISLRRVDRTRLASPLGVPIACRTSSRANRRCPPAVRSQGIFPLAAHFRTVTGCTPSSRATSPAVNVLAT